MNLFMFDILLFFASSLSGWALEWFGNTDSLLAHVAGIAVVGALFGLVPAAVLNTGSRLVDCVRVKRKKVHG